MENETKKRLLYLARIAVLILLYYYSARFGLRQNSAIEYATLVWPPSGLSLAFLLIFGFNLWPAIFIAAALTNLNIGAPAMAAFGIGVGSTLEIIFAVKLLSYFNFKKDLSTLKSVVLLIIVGAFLGPLISSVIGTTSLWLTDAIATAEYRHIWKTWWAGNCLAALTITPILLTWASFYESEDKIKNKIEASVFFISFIILFAILYSDQFKHLTGLSLQIPFLLFPFIMWAGLRFGQMGVCSLVFLTSVGALWGASYGYGPFAYSSSQAKILFLYTFLGIISITGMIIAAITAERHRAKEELKNTLIELEKRSDHLAAILKGINDGITVVDSNNHFVFANDIGAKVYGFSSVEEMMSSNPTDAQDKFEIMDENGNPFPHDQLPCALVMNGIDSPAEVIIRFRRKGSLEEKWSIVKSNAISNKSSKVRLAVNVFKDFTERKLLEDSIKYLDEASRVLGSSLDYEQTLAQIAKLAVYKIADWCSIDILKNNDATPQSVAVQHADPEKLKFAQELIKKYPQDWTLPTGAPYVLRTGESVLHSTITEHLIRRNCKTDEQYQLYMSLGLKSAMIVPLISRGKVFGVITLISAESGRAYTKDDLIVAEELARRGGIAIDNALLFAEAQKLAEAAEKANQVKSLFLANMSHEIRSPLGAILGFNSLISEPHLTQMERQKYTEIISRNGLQLTQLIDDILDLSKVEAGHLDTEILEVSLPALMTDITTLINHKAKEKNLFFSVISAGITPEFIYTDPTRLHQILMNIIGNAIKFTCKGGVKVVLRADPVGTLYPKNIFITVEDTGAGIPIENQSRLFEWFTQAEASTTRKFGGTGLGLALSRRLARALKGDVVLTQSSDKGTIFTIQIANQIENYKRPAHTENKEKQRSLKDLNNQLNGIRILLVDDSPDNRMLIERILSQRGAFIDSVENGKEGVEKALKENYDLILMDIQMPIFDGIQATAELRRLGYSKPIIALTAHAMKEERERTLATGCDAHLTKPIEIPKLLNIIAELGHQHH